MTELIKLYRGDNVFIDKHQTNKTAKHNYLGQGIYLTDNLKVAESYIAKNETKRFAVGFSSGKSERYWTRGQNGINNMLDAKKAFMLDICCQLIYSTEKKDISAKDLLKPQHATLLKKYSKVFEEWMEAGHITFKYEQSGKIIKGIAIDPAALEMGHISEFHVPKDLLEKNVFEIEFIRRYKKEFWSICHREKLPFARLDISKSEEDYLSEVEKHIDSRIYNQPLNKPLVELCGRAEGVSAQISNEKMIRVFKKHGAKGFEYGGGAHIGGFGRHRAFSIWDDDWIHEFRAK